MSHHTALTVKEGNLISIKAKDEMRRKISFSAIRIFQV